MIHRCREEPVISPVNLTRAHVRIRADARRPACILPSSFLIAKVCCKGKQGSRAYRLMRSTSMHFAVVIPEYWKSHSWDIR